MTEKQFVIGLDIGTTSAKAVIFHKNGIVLAENEQPYPVKHPEPGWAEQDPVLIEEAAIKALRTAIINGKINGKNILSVGLSSAMHSLICIDNKWDALSPSITWADGRAISQADNLKNTDKGTSIYLRTGTPIHPMSPLTKLIWMRENRIEAYEQAKRFVSIKEFLTGRWFDTASVDYSIASATGMFDIETLSWNEEALELAGISVSQLSTPVEPTFIFQGMHPSIAERIGIPADIPFAAGGSDGPLANLGIGAIDPGETAITIGTSGAIRQMNAKPRTDEKQQVFCYAFSKERWILGGPINNGGIVLQWLNDVLGQETLETAINKNEDPYTIMLSAAEKVAPGANGLLFLPYLNGERAPHWDANARASFIGLSMHHHKSHMVRAGLEGVLFSLLSVSAALRQLTGETNTLYASGGFARSSFWVQMLADIFGQDIHLPMSHQSSAWGAAWCSLLAVNEVNTFQEIKEHIPMRDTIKPHMETHQTYTELYQVYRSLYDSLKPTFTQLAAFRNSS